MVTFKNPLLSISGQKERLKNVVDVLKISLNPLSKKKVVADVKSPTLKSGLEFLGNNPFTTAGLAAGGAKTIASKAISTPLKAGITALGGGILVTSSKARVKTIETVTKITPENLIKTGGDIGKIIESDKSLKEKVVGVAEDVAKVSLLAAGGLILTKEVVDFTQGEGFFGIGKDKPLEESLPKEVVTQSSKEEIIAPTQTAAPMSNPTQPINSISTTKKRRKRAKTKPQTQIIKQSVVLNVKQSNSTKKYLNRGYY